MPVINISTASVDAGKEMLDAAVEYGFLYVDSTSTQFDKKTVDEMFELVCVCFAFTQGRRLILFANYSPVPSILQGDSLCREG